MTILASHTLEIQIYLFIRFIIILLITKNITKIITKIAEVSQRFHFGASGSPKVSLAEVLVGKGSQSFHFGRFPALPPREARRPPKWPKIAHFWKIQKTRKNFEFFFSFFFFFVFSDCFSFLVVPRPSEKRGGHQNGRFLAKTVFSFFRFFFIFFHFIFVVFVFGVPGPPLSKFLKIQNT